MTKISETNSIEEQIESIQKEIRETPYHKGTEHHIGRLRARIARLKDKQIDTASKSKGGGGGGYAVKHQGDATVILIGPPSAGKSTLLNRLTNAKSRVAPYAFTTVSVIPGMMEYKNARIQILDVPGLIEGAEEGKGRGREVLSVARGADLIVLMTDVARPEAIDRIKAALERNGLRLNIVRPNVLIEKKVSGGIILHTNIKQGLSKETIKSVIAELGIKNAEVTIKENLNIERLIDAFSPSRVYSPSISVFNKSDMLNNENLVLPNPNVTYNDISYISAENSIGLEELKEKMWSTLNFINVYLVRQDDEPNFNSPVVMKSGENLYQVAQKIGPEFVQGLTHAKIWENGAKFPGQDVSLTLFAQDGMQVRFI